MRWEDAVEAWRAENPQRSERWKKTELQFIRWFDARLQGVELQGITRALVERLRGELLRYDYSPKTVNHHLATLRAILRASVEREWIPAAPRVRLLKIEPRVRWITPAEAMAVLRALPPHLRDMATFALETGLRKSNVAGLRWSWVQLGRRVVMLPGDAMKNRRPLALPLSPLAVRIVKRHRGEHADFVFTFRGEPLQEPGGLAWRKALRVAGVSNFRWHDLRHTWASWLAQGGASQFVLKQLGGWSSDAMPARYAHMNIEHLRAWTSRRSPLRAA